MSGRVQIAEGLDMDPGEAATQTLGTIAAKGGGKSYLAGKFVEQLHDAGAPFLVLDPVGNWSALTLAKDGKSPGLAVVVIGGERADVPLDEEQAEAIGQYLVWNGVSAVLDLSELSKTKRKSYVAALCESVYRTARKKRAPFMVVFEEAQLFAPQVCPPGEQRMLGAVTDIVRLGRNYGLGSMLVTQRPQSVSKEVLNQVECLFVGQLRGPQERKAIKGWITEQGASITKDVLEDLPSLEPGEFCCWSPSWLRVFKRVRILPKRTFDGSSTPTLGGVGPRPTGKANRSLGGVVEELAELSRRPEPTVTVQLSRAEVNEYRESNSRLEQENRRLTEKLARLESMARRVRGVLDDLEEVEPALSQPVKSFTEVVRESEPSEIVYERLKPQRPTRVLVDPAGNASMSSFGGAKVPGLDKADRLILSVLSWQSGPIPKKRLALLAGYTMSGGGFKNALGRRKGAGHLDVGAGGIAITPAGVKALPDAPPKPPTGAKLFDWWLTHPKVDTCMRGVMQALRAAGGSLERGPLAQRAGLLVRQEPYQADAGGFKNALGRLRTLGLIEGGGKEMIALVADLRR